MFQYRKPILTLFAVFCTSYTSLLFALDHRLAWENNNRQVLEEFIDHEATLSKKNGKKPIAVFDWDNTVIKNDIGDATFFYMLQNNEIFAPSSWESTSKHLTKASIHSLNEHCTTPLKNSKLNTKENKSCTTAMLCIILSGKVWSGEAAAGNTEKRCTGPNAFRLKDKATEDTIEPAYAWFVSLQSGHLPNAIRRMALNAFKENLQRHVGSTFSLGYLQGLNGYIRVYPQMRDLIQTLHSKNFDVWISTASGQFVVDAIAPFYVGVPRDRVIGVQSILDEKGRITPLFQGCGTFSDGEQNIINYRQGKRCWVNKVVFQLEPKDQLKTSSPISLALGDSDTDVFFLKDAEGLRVAIDRHKEELMCNALENIDGKWLIQPMFIKPKSPKTDFSCNKYKNVFGKRIKG